MTPTARKLGVPDKLRSCHTSQIGGYAIEGHVPAADVKRLLATKPKATGLAVPGMVAGSPGMEQGNYKEPIRFCCSTKPHNEGVRGALRNSYPQFLSSRSESRTGGLRNQPYQGRVLRTFGKRSMGTPAASKRWGYRSWGLAI